MNVIQEVSKFLQHCGLWSNTVSGMLRRFGGSLGDNYDAPSTQGISSMWHKITLPNGSTITMRSNTTTARSSEYLCTIELNCQLLAGCLKLDSWDGSSRDAEAPESDQHG